MLHPPNTRSPRPGRRFVVAVALTVVSTLPTAADTRHRILSSADTVVHETTAEVRHQRVIPATDSLEILTWDEVAPDGGVESFYAYVSLDGAVRGRVRSTAYRIALADVAFDPLADTHPVVPPSLRAAPDSRLHLVQLVASALPELQDELVGLGGVIHRYYTDHTLLVEMDVTTRSSVATLPWVRWIGPYHPAYRLEPPLRDALASESGELGRERYSIMATRRGAATQEALAEVVRARGGQVEIQTPQGFRMEATLDAAGLEALAHDDRVHYIDRWGGPAQTDMDIVREVGGADYVEGLTGFSGEGVRGEILDTELRVTHQEWLNAPLVHSSTSSGAVAHGTSVTSNVFAQGINADARGMAPDGQSIFFVSDEVTQFGGAVSRYTIAQELLDPAGPYTAVFQTASVGNTQVTTYTTISAEMDDVLFQHQLIHTQSQSNTGNQNSRPQAWAKNIVAVGGIRHLGTADRSDDNWGFGASIGPAQDGRIKPDLSFFYDSILSASRGSDTSYTSFGGTSSATPQTAGHFGMFFQMWHEGVWPGRGGGASVFASRPHMATAKAMLIHEAYRYDWNSGGANADLDRFKQGWGTANLQNLFDRALETSIVDEEVVLAPLETYSQSVTVAAGEPMLKATLVYVDPMGTPGAGAHRINDLSLRVTSPSNTIYWGNNGLTLDNVSTSGGVSNTLDTVENVFVANPEAGVWTVEVLADEIVQDSHPETGAVDADFALIVSPSGAIFADGFESGMTSAWSAATP